MVSHFFAVFLYGITRSGSAYLPFGNYHVGCFPVLHLSVRNHAERFSAFAIRR